MLGQHGLQEVYTGGIGSYCLLNMIVAHLQVSPSPQVLKCSATLALQDMEAFKEVKGVLAGRVFG